MELLISYLNEPQKVGETVPLKQVNQNFPY